MRHTQNNMLRILILAVGCQVMVTGLLAVSMVQAYPGHVVINEVLASNSHSNYDGDFGEYSDWVELYNPSGSDVDLEGWYLSDDPADPDKWRIPGNTVIPAGGYFLFWADDRDLRPGQKAWTQFTEPEEITVMEYHLNFRINSGLEEILLFDNKLDPVDAILLRDQTRDFSSGRDGEGDWYYLGEITPLAVNSPISNSELSFSGIPEFSISGGLYPGSRQLELSGSGNGTVIRYTTDGSKPSSVSPEYTGPIPVHFSQVIKARLFEPGKLPGKVATESYIVQKETSLPVLSVSTDHENLWGFDFGLYQRNLKNREVFAHLEYFDESGNRAFRINAGLQLFGSQIFLFDQKPFSIFFRNRYGQDSLQYKLFRNRETDSYHSLVLRNGGNDNNLTMIRDGLGAALVENQMDMDYQSYLPVVVYMNGEYWGIFNLREKLNEDYLENTHGVNPDYINILEDSLRVNKGDENDYRELMDFVSGNDLTEEENYAYVTGKIDVNQFINYMSYKIYGGYRQWQVNSKYWRERTLDSPWRWIAFDMEHCFGGPGSDSYEVNTFAGVLEPGEGSSEWPTLLFRKLMENQGFRAAFLQRTALFLDTVFDEDRVANVIDSLKGRIEAEMEHHIARWNSPVSRAVWLQHMDYLEEFARNRNRHLRAHMMSYFSIPDTSGLTLQCGAGGKIAVAGALVQDSGVVTYKLFNVLPVHLKALPEPGYTFAGWNHKDLNSQLDLILSGDTLLEAVFEPSGADLIPDTVRGTLVLENSPGPWYSSGNVFVPAGDTLIFEQGVEVRMMPDASLIVEGCLIIDGSPDMPVIIDVNPGAVDGYLVSSKSKWGGIIIRSEHLASIRYMVLKNASSANSEAGYKGALSAVNSKLELSGVEISGVKDPVWCYASEVRIDSCVLSSRGTGDVINLRYCEGPVITHNELRGNHYEDTDAIDLDSVSGAIVEDNKIYSFFGFNSDGIDLGEACRDIHIRGNTIMSCSDKGISVGQASEIEADFNIIVNCGQGFGIKDSGSFARINRNTLYGNLTGIACFEKNPGRGGGSAQVENTIIAGSVEGAVFVDSLSVLTISYSHSDTDTLPGYNNLHGNPLFVDASDLDFFLRESSLCIDAGNPTQQDPDGSRADMGVYISHPQTSPFELLISEINFDPHPVFDAGDWIEIHNAGNKSMDLSGWVLKGENEDDEFIFPDHLELDPGGYLVIAEDPDSVISLHGSFKGAADWLLGRLPFGLNAGGECLYLYNSDYLLVHAFRFGPGPPWPDGPNGKGATLELYKGEMDNSHPGNWHASHLLGGTPGNENSAGTLVTGLFINELMAKNSSAFPDNAGEYDDWVEVYNHNDYPVNLGGLCFLRGNPESEPWMIPLYDADSTTIGPGGFRMFWADQDPEQGILHTGFKLPASGGSIALARAMDKGYHMIDEISYGTQQQDAAFGRYPDGGDLLTVLRLSPGNPNRLITSVDVRDESCSFHVYPNPTRTFLVIEYDAGKLSSCFLQNMNGQTVSQIRLDMGGSTRLDVSGLPPGIYILRLTECPTCSAKVVIR
jgi:CotH protein/lamin tail-like protein/chitobiase/beta-hexosaminidase-like protein/parallel beta helix pectate lyase-like protein/type IX secretion system substrate protein